MSQVDIEQRIEELRPELAAAIAFAEEWPEAYRPLVLRLLFAGGPSPPTLKTMATADEQGFASIPAEGRAPLQKLGSAVGVDVDLLRRVIHIDPETGAVRIMGRIHGNSMRDTQNKYSAVYAFVKEKALGEN